MRAALKARILVGASFQSRDGACVTHASWNCLQEDASATRSEKFTHDWRSRSISSGVSERRWAGAIVAGLQCVLRRWERSWSENMFRLVSLDIDFAARQHTLVRIRIVNTMHACAVFWRYIRMDMWSGAYGYLSLTRVHLSTCRMLSSAIHKCLTTLDSRTQNPKEKHLRDCGLSRYCFWVRLCPY